MQFIHKKPRSYKNIGVFTCSSLNLSGMEQIWAFIESFIKERKNKEFLLRETYKNKKIMEFC